MRILVTGSAGHLGEGLVRTLRARGDEVVGLDLIASAHTNRQGSIADPDLVRRLMRGTDYVIHAATLHKPHVATHRPRDFIETNLTGTANVLDGASAEGVRGVVFTSTTSAFGRALGPAADGAARWIDESVRGRPKNVYGLTKTAAEDLCELHHERRGLPILVLRTARFFPEEDDREELREAYPDLNLKVNELLYRRLDLEDAVAAHLCAIEACTSVGFARYVVSATTPFEKRHLERLGHDAPGVVRELLPDFEEVFGALGFRMFPTIDRVYDNARARRDLGWRPRIDFRVALDRLARGEPVFSELSRAVGRKGYHPESFSGVPYPTEPDP